MFEIVDDNIVLIEAAMMALPFGSKSRWDGWAWCARGASSRSVLSYSEYSPYWY
jgi:hypothetical protein